MKNVSALVRFSSLTAVVLMVGCASTGHLRGSVALKTSETEGEVCLGTSEVEVGDKVTLYRSECVKRPIDVRHDHPSRCTKTKIGEAEITQVLDEHYSTTKVPAGVKFAEGTIVELVR
jgi:hypothetical protein